ncbi:hypothetical protein J31TS6_49640 [Brevibacillus reuszeri]|uniref:hypothetical protein n=1 Tax=Brevibacillus reuszeri TaxID=54915 RepID=UPI001B23F0D1|nr:hypothetical protein [Brevibacillus reuszeri]GIO08936.1 hypothetical protein J31TS6_49640 [Brevibacillus reuszeri]
MIRKHRRQKNVRDARQPPTQKLNKPAAKLTHGLTTDAFSNVLARLGSGTPNHMEGTGKIIDAIPEDMTRNWITITSTMEPGNIRKLDKLWRGGISFKNETNNFKIETMGRIS